MIGEHQHEWERGTHIAAAFGIDGRRLACAVCGIPKSKVGAVPEQVDVPDRIRVTVLRKDRDGANLTDDILWPRGWPIPEAGSIVSVNLLAGWVDHVEFDVVSSRIVIVLR